MMRLGVCRTTTVSPPPPPPLKRLLLHDLQTLTTLSSHRRTPKPPLSKRALPLQGDPLSTLGLCCVLHTHTHTHTSREQAGQKGATCYVHHMRRVVIFAQPRVIYVGFPVSGRATTTRSNVLPPAFIFFWATGQATHKNTGHTRPTYEQTQHVWLCLGNGYGRARWNKDDTPIASPGQ